MLIVDLPEDVLSIIFLFLDPKSFLALCTSTKVLYADYQRNPLFWRTKVATTFRTPISPLLKADGARWYSLYQRLRTQTRLYTWGQGVKGNLGQGVGPRLDPNLLPGSPRPQQILPLPRSPPGPHGRAMRGRIIPARPRPTTFQRISSYWPTEAHVPDDVGVVADLQCGGWSTIILSSSGKLYIAGCIDARDGRILGGQTDRFERLEFLTQSTSAIAQFSAGRAHVLALTDDGEVVSWDRINAKGLKIYSRHGGKLPGKPARVVAGWGESSAYAPDVGIMYWSPPKNDQEDDVVDAREVKERVIPNTTRALSADGTLYEVTAHVVLEGMIIWTTGDSKVWACQIDHDNEEDTEPRGPCIQLPGYFDGADLVKDIQGSFRHFVVFTGSGRVLAGNVDYVQLCFEAAQRTARENIDGQTDAVNPSTWANLNFILSSRPRDIPALQNTGVISVRFGDWHSHALHSDGTVTSHGHEPQSCGALGLGEAHQGGRLRGMIKPQGLHPDTNLQPVADIRGRQVWFEHEKRDWLGYLQHTAEQHFASHQDQPYWREILHDHAKQTMFSEWIEQEGRHWEDGPISCTSRLPETRQQTKPQHGDGLEFKTYFALAIGAAGWHSGALVLVDDDKAEQVRRKWIRQDHSQERGPDIEAQAMQLAWTTESFPRTQLPDGTEAPVAGDQAPEQTVENALRPWRDGMPTMQDLGLESSQG
ncbi:hypothetical protein LTS08_006484 [Lithohypha guttulata]|nr:hypothetical protein LTS08_006484 [Lithohypha guttulata]